jgi:hypothetical protein
MAIQENILFELAKLRPNSTFLTLKGYRNAHGEISDYSIVFNVSYENSLKKSILCLKDLIPSDDLEAKAKEQLIASYNKSLISLETTPFEELEDNYVHFRDENNKYIKGIKYHKASKTTHLYGFVVHKKVIIPGSYPKVNKLPLTLAKEKLAKTLSVSKFRQFKVVPEQLDYISVNNLTLLPE